jgi:predicted metal-dependent phosphoesterase TrpH
MSDLIDLHLHSTFSDGVMTPTELVAEAASIGLKAIALADHDNVDGIPEALAAGELFGVEVLAAVELSTLWKGLTDLHLLGYAFDHQDPALQEALGGFRDFRAERSERILANVNRRLLAEGRKSLDFSEVRRRAGGSIGRPHIGQALLAAGYVRDMDEAFNHYLVPCNEPKRFFPLDEAIRLIHNAGGCAVLAHPPFIGVDDERLPDLLDEFIALGLDGLEAYCSGVGNDGIDRYITAARRKGLIITGGSDFHQPLKGGVVMGAGRGNLKIPYRCVEEIKARVARGLSYRVSPVG